MEPFFILALFRHGYKARTSTLYHLLKGKRTTSVLIYGFLYDNLRFFQLCPELSEAQFNKIIADLQKKQLLKQLESDVQLTEQGQEILRSSSFHFDYLDNYQFGKTDIISWRMLQFTVQVVSHLSYDDKTYIPLEQSPFVQKQLKMLLKSYPKRQLIQTMKREWAQLFTLLPEEQADFFAQQFSGYHQIGKTSYQLLDTKKTNFSRILEEKEAIHKLFTLILTTKDIYFLQRIIEPYLKQNENQSMIETSLYVNGELSLDELARRRKLKRSTVQDHLLELALTKDFPFERYLSQESSVFLDTVTSDYPSWNYRELKQSNPQLDYFEFRLYQILKIREGRETDK